MSQVSLTKVLKVAPDTVWQKVKAFDDIHKLLGIVTSTTVHGSGVGAKRVCTMKEGPDAHETILTLDDKNQKLSYKLENIDGMPVKNYIGAWEVKDADNGFAQVTLGCTYEPNGMSESDLNSMFEGVCGEILGNLETLLA